MWRELSEKFYESYTRTRDMAGTLEYVFWITLPESVKGVGVDEYIGKDSLNSIFEYSRRAIAQEG